MNTYDYQNTKVVGKWAVDQLIEHFQAHWSPYVHDVQDDKFFQVLDVDLVVVGEFMKPTFVEVKGDRHLTGNAYIETVSNFELDKPGCFIYTGADIVAYYFVRKGQCVMIPVPEFQAWMTDNIHRYDQKQVGSKSGKGAYTSRGYPVPVKDILAEIHGCWVINDLPIMEQ